MPARICDKREIHQGIALVIVGGIIAVAVGVIIAVSLQQSAEIEFCDNWSEDLETQRQQLNTRANTLGGQLDLSGDLEADTIAFNQDVHRYNEECANGGGNEIIDDQKAKAIMEYISLQPSKKSDQVGVSWIQRSNIANNHQNENDEVHLYSPQVEPSSRKSIFDTKDWF